MITIANLVRQQASRHAIFVAFVLSVGLTLSLPVLSTARADEKFTREEIVTFVQELAKGTIEVVNAEGRTDDQRRLDLADIMSSKSSVEKTARFALGKFARRQAKDERPGYYDLARLFAAKTMYQYLRSIPEVDLRITKIVTKGKKKNQYVVFSEAMIPGADRSLSIGWWLIADRDSEPQLKLFDFAFEGVWLAQSQRSVFVSVLNKSRGNFNKLYKYMRDVLEGDDDIENADVVKLTRTAQR